MVGLLTWIIIGGFAGWIAGKIIHNELTHSIGRDIVVGMIGAIIGGLLVQLIGGAGFTGFSI
jgi:uncharacterized membrane protein YeaQ/YmgE (transglycosylase-associated protein family)